MYVCMYVYMCVRVRVCERERERKVCVCVCVVVIRCPSYILQVVVVRGCHFLVSQPRTHNHHIAALTSKAAGARCRWTHSSAICACACAQCTTVEESGAMTDTLC